MKTIFVRASELWPLVVEFGVAMYQAGEAQHIPNEEERKARKGDAVKAEDDVFRAIYGPEANYNHEFATNRCDFIDYGDGDY